MDRSIVPDVPDGFRLSDDLWSLFRSVLPADPPRKRGGRPRLDPRRVASVFCKKRADAIFFVLRTGAQWKSLPKSLCSGSTAHKWFQQWTRQGVFSRLWRLCLEGFDSLVGIDWLWQAMDGCITKAPLGQEATGPNPTDRSKRGTKRSVLVDGHGVPIGVSVDGANRHDMKLVERTLASIPVEHPDPFDTPQNLLLDKGYDYTCVRDSLHDLGYADQICGFSENRILSRGKERQARLQIPGYRAKRWIVERTHSWVNRFRRLLVRWEKKAGNDLALLHLAFATITHQATNTYQESPVYG